MAYVLSSVSGNLISAASAGFAPTNSADVSAIASAYQVVSATATQLYAGTAYVTSVNEAPVSAERAGNAANASLATSAYYDGTGRLISALPDSATVSAIASSYAESAVSSKADSSSLSSYVPYSGLEYYDTAISGIDGSSLYDYSAHARITTVAGRVTSLSAEMSSKLDSSAASSFYPADNPSGFISSVDLSDYATTAYVDSSISGFAYESAVSAWTAKQDQLTFGYNTANQISSIDGSALGGMDEAAVSGIASAYAESAVSSVSGNYYTTANESGFLTAQAQASWSESASASPSYIQDKPDLVDIVAGPGIVIDNPDGNTLRVSMAADYETVLWDSAVSGSAFRITLSEPPTNFERLEFIGYTNDGIKYPMYGYGYTDNFSATGVQQYFMRTTTYSHDKVMWFDIGSDGGVSGVAQYEHDIRTTNAYSPKNNFSITKIVGINRISGGN